MEAQPNTDKEIPQIAEVSDPLPSSTAIVSIQQPAPSNQRTATNESITSFGG